MAGVGLSAVEGAYHLQQGNYGEAGWAGADALMAGVGVFGGPVGLGVSALYFAGRFAATC